MLQILYLGYRSNRYKWNTTAFITKIKVATPKNCVLILLRKMSVYRPKFAQSFDNVVESSMCWNYLEF